MYFCPLIVVFTHFQEELPAIETFLATYFRTWNGVDFADQIFALLSMIRPLSFDGSDLCNLFYFMIFFKLSFLNFPGFSTCYLKPLQKLFFSSSVAWKVKLLSSLSSLLHNWASLDWKLFYDTEEGKTGTKLMELVFERPSAKTDHFRTIHDFIVLMDSMCVLALQAENDHVLLQHAVLSFFEVVVTLHTHYDVPFVVIPSRAIVFRSLLSDTGMAVSRICGVVTRFANPFIFFFSFLFFFLWLFRLPNLSTLSPQLQGGFQDPKERHSDLGGDLCWLSQPLLLERAEQNRAPQSVHLGHLLSDVENQAFERD